ncbi:polysaccharide deacetylase family protein [Halalkalicoccus salilacus]|uniref:polysaccharide deacetylase family protein n=1 Tax=Halalkalicoccus salilacus TaxID=3117459 RepID=UPI00300ECC1F
MTRQDIRNSRQNRDTNQSRPTRRQALRTLGVIGGLSLAGCLDQGGNLTSNDKERDEGGNDSEDQQKNGTEQENETEEETNERLNPPENGAVVFVYDDGPVEDYTKAFPVHQQFKAPATVGITSTWIGRENYMGIKHLEKLADAGWEICSHTTEHLPIASFKIQKDIGADDREIYPTEIRHGHHEGKEVELTDGANSVIRTVEGLGGEPEDPHVVLTEAVGEPFKTGETVIRYPRETLHESLSESKRKLEKHGFEVDTLLAPYDRFNEWSMEFAPEYYTGVANANYETRINSEGFNPFETQRGYFIENANRSVVESDLDEIAGRGALGVFGAHTVKDEVTQELIWETLEWIDERGIEVMTLRDAFAHFAEPQNSNK